MYLFWCYQEDSEKSSIESSFKNVSSNWSAGITFLFCLKAYELLNSFGMTTFIIKNPGSNHEAEGQASSNAMDANSKSKKEEGFIYIGPHYECEKCNFSTIHIFSMRMHLRGHQRNQLIKCRLCSFSSTNQFVIGRHLNLHHRNASSAAGTDDRSASNSQVTLSDYKIH